MWPPCPRTAWSTRSAAGRNSCSGSIRSCAIRPPDPRSAWATALFHQHPAHGGAHPAFFHPGPQRRDQHHRAAAQRLAESGYRSGARRQRFPGSEPGIEGLINRYGLRATEAFAMVFPAVHSEVEHYPEDLRRGLSNFSLVFSALGPGAGRGHRPARRRVHRQRGRPGTAAAVVRGERLQLLSFLGKRRGRPGRHGLGPRTPGPGEKMAIFP
jgi:hypothetical protein